MNDSGSGWSSFAKAIAVVFGVIVVLAVVGVIAGVYWWQHHGREFVQEGQAAMERGRAEGASTDEDGCLRVAFESARRDTGINTIVQTDLRLRGCLASAKVSEHFCTAVPKVTAFVESTRWRMERCGEEKAASSRCGMLGAVQEYCYSKERRMKLENPQNKN